MGTTGSSCLFSPSLGVNRGTCVCVHVFKRTRVFVCEGAGLCLFGREAAVVSGTLSLRPFQGAVDWSWLASCPPDIPNPLNTSSSF